MVSGLTLTHHNAFSLVNFRQIFVKTQTGAYTWKYQQAYSACGTLWQAPWP